MADKTKFITIEGKCKWARLYTMNMDTKFGDKYNVDLYLDSRNTNILKESGFRGKQRSDDDGPFYKFSRDNISSIEGKGGPPEVVDEFGAPFNQLIGNGSKLAIVLEVYPSKYGMGSRIKKVTVLDHVAYENPSLEESGPPVD